MATEERITACRSCGAPMAFVPTAAGKRQPRDVVDGKVTDVSHFATCPERDQWRKKPKASP